MKTYLLNEFGDIFTTDNPDDELMLSLSDPGYPIEITKTENNEK